MTRALSTVLMLGLLAMTPFAARAQEDARALFQRGVALGDEGRWADALESFERSYELAPRASTQFNIASTLMRLGRAVRAREVIRTYLQRPDVRRDDGRSRPARELAELAQGQITELTIHVSPDSTSLEIDGRVSPERGTVRQLSIDAGEHVFRFEAEGFESLRREARLSPGEQTVRVALTAAAPPTQAALVVDGPDADPERDPTSEAHDEAHDEGGGVLSSPWFWIVTAVLVIGGGVAAAILLTQTGGGGAPNGGNTGVILEALSW
jgi:hypothetical protein